MIYTDQPRKDDINAVGGWDALDNWDNSTFDLNEMLFNVIGKHSTGALFSVSVQMDPTNYTKSILVVDQGSYQNNQNFCHFS